ITPSVGPSISSRRRHSRPNSTRPFSVSSTTGAPNVAATYSPVLAPSAGIVTYSRSAVLMTSAARAAIPAPQTNANARFCLGSGSSRSIHSTSAISSGTGSSASGSAIANGAGPSPNAKDCTASIPTVTNAQKAATAIPTMKPTGVRPGSRSSSTATGSNGSAGAAGSAGSAGSGASWGSDAPEGADASGGSDICGSILRTPAALRCAFNGHDWSRPIARFGLDQRYGEPCGNGLPRHVSRKRGGIGSKAWHGGHGGLRPARLPPRNLPPESADVRRSQQKGTVKNGER